MTKYHTIVLTEGEMKSFRLSITMREWEHLTAARRIELGMTPGVDMFPAANEKPKGLDYFDQDAWWFSANKGWTPVGSMHPKHAANSYLWMLQNAVTLYERWMPDTGYSDIYKIGYVGGSKLAQAVYDRAKEGNGFNIPN
jgi:hypothetical protein